METKPSLRRYDLDWLRVLAFTGVFFYHCARFFNGSDWHVKNAETSAVIDMLTSVFEMWGMPLIFIISGASVFFALHPGRALSFLRDRGLRLLVPLAFGILVLAPPQIYLERLTHGDFQGSFLQFLPRYFAGDFAWTGVHLWYLEYLFVFTLALTPLFVWLKRPAGQRLIAGISRISVRPGAIFLWALPYTLLFVVVDPLGLLRPSLSEALLRLIIYPLFLVYGYVIYADAGIQGAIIRQRRAALVLVWPNGARRSVGRQRPSRHQARVMKASRAASAMRPVNIGVSVTPRVTWASRSFKPSQPEPDSTRALTSMETRGTSTASPTTPERMPPPRVQ